MRIPEVGTDEFCAHSEACPKRAPGCGANDAYMVLAGDTCMVQCAGARASEGT